MLYKVECLTPANTPKSSPVVTICRVYPGEVTQVWIGFPKGCYGLCHLQVRHWGWPVWPWSPADSFHWNDFMFSFADKYPLTAEPYEFKILTWNLDDFYPHTPTFMVLVEPDRVVTPPVDLEQVYADLGLSPGGF